MNTARVVAYSAGPEDTRLTQKIECTECSVEWGWTTDAPGVYDELKTLADHHNRHLHEDQTWRGERL